MTIFLSIVFLMTWLLLLNYIGLSALAPNIKRDRPQELVSFLLEGDFENVVPQYKFFGQLLEDLIALRNRLGCEINHALMEIRSGIRVDIKFSKRLKSSLFGGIYQYSFICIFAWFFLFYASSSIKAPISQFAIISLSTVQLLGLSLYLGLFSYLKKSKFTLIEKYIQASYSFKILLTISRPLSEVLEISQLNELSVDKELKYYKNRSLKIIDQIKVRGQLPKAELDNLMLELWDVFEVKQEQFEKHHTVLKLGIMTIFALPSFLFVISTIMKSLMPA